MQSLNQSQHSFEVEIVMRSLRKKDRKKIETKTWPDFWTKLDNFSQSVAV
jgi:hypothetical protein